MARYVALLRSVNLGSYGRVAMPDLVRSFDALGYQDVSTYIQSGNVLFSTTAKSATRLAGDIEERLNADFGTSPAVIVRSAKDLLRVGSSSPYARGGADPARHHVTFLAEAPSRQRLAAFTTPKSGNDELTIDGLEVYVSTPDGYHGSKLTGTYLERHLGVLSTTRNWNTVTKLCGLLGA
jgi:uncharacterized protein (DUF1697 family)